MDNKKRVLLVVLSKCKGALKNVHQSCGVIGAHFCATVFAVIAFGGVFVRTFFTIAWEFVAAIGYADAEFRG